MKKFVWLPLAAFLVLLLIALFAPQVQAQVTEVWTPTVINVSGDFAANRGSDPVLGVAGSGVIVGSGAVGGPDDVSSLSPGTLGPVAGTLGKGVKHYDGVIWQGSGGWAIGDQVRVAGRPGNSSQVAAGSAGAGTPEVKLSTDGGQSFASLPAPAQFVFGIGAATWCGSNICVGTADGKITLVNPNTGAKTDFAGVPANLAYNFMWGESGGAVWAAATDAGGANRVYRCDGANCTEKTPGVTTLTYGQGVVDSSSGNVYVPTDQGVYRCPGGVNCSLFNSGLATAAEKDVRAVAANGGKIFAATGAGVKELVSSSSTPAPTATPTSAPTATPTPEPARPKPKPWFITAGTWPWSPIRAENWALGKIGVVGGRETVVEIVPLPTGNYEMNPSKQPQWGGWPVECGDVIVLLYQLKKDGLPVSWSDGIREFRVDPHGNVFVGFDRNWILAQPTFLSRLRAVDPEWHRAHPDWLNGSIVWVWRTVGGSPWLPAEISEASWTSVTPLYRTSAWWVGYVVPNPPEPKRIAACDKGIPRPIAPWYWPNPGAVRSTSVSPAPPAPAQEGRQMVAFPIWRPWRP